jgi:GNAT superfamily N-acetyltransferase
MTAGDWPEVGALIHASTNHWYVAHTGIPVFTCTPEDTLLFCSEYEALDTGCCFVLRDHETGKIVASCFYHPRPTHISLGILNVHPEYLGKGAARRVLNAVVEMGNSHNLPVRLVSSLMNLDSFSLYNRAGFVPRATYQDMVIPAESGRLTIDGALSRQVRDAVQQDAMAMASLEFERCGIQRLKDFQHILANRSGIWHTSVMHDAKGEILGFLSSCAHPATCMLGPGFMRDDCVGEALICRELAHRLPLQPLFLTPSCRSELLNALYRRGAKNVELHTSQCLGHWHEPNGVMIPTFLPESA